MYFCDTYCVTNYSISILNYIYWPLQCQLPGSATADDVLWYYPAAQDVWGAG